MYMGGSVCPYFYESSTSEPFELFSNCGIQLVYHRANVTYIIWHIDSSVSKRAIDISRLLLRGRKVFSTHDFGEDKSMHIKTSIKALLMRAKLCWAISLQYLNCYAQLRCSRICIYD